MPKDEEDCSGLNNRFIHRLGQIAGKGSSKSGKHWTRPEFSFRKKKVNRSNRVRVAFQTQQELSLLIRKLALAVEQQPLLDLEAIRTSRIWEKVPYAEDVDYPSPAALALAFSVPPRQVVECLCKPPKHRCLIHACLGIRKCLSPPKSRRVGVGLTGYNQGNWVFSQLTQGGPLSHSSRN